MPFPQARLTLLVGMYSVFLKDWLSVFPASQLLVIRKEDYEKQIKSTMREVFTFLDIGKYINNSYI